MALSLIGFSAQFGGQDAAAAVLPHFKALKVASSDLQFQGFPFPKLAYILRVDGEISRYGRSGAENLDIDSGGEYLSIDIVITEADRERIVDAICIAIASSIEMIGAISASNGWSTDFMSLRTCLGELIARYRRECSIQHIV